jgi:hypothetical protein
VAQARASLAPGTYDLLVVAAVPRGDRTGLARRVVVVPEPSDGLELSDIIPLVELQPVVARALASHDEPFYLGAFEAVPRTNRPLHPGDAVRLIYEIYGGEGPYRVTYTLEGMETDGTWIGLGRPATVENAQPAQGWELPTGSSWPLGEYRIRVEVSDRAGAVTRSILPFELRERPGPAGSVSSREPATEAAEPDSGS